MSTFDYVSTLIRPSLLAEKAPYVITLFVAALGWTALRTADRLEQVAFVEYSTHLVSQAGESPDSFAAVRLKNVTKSKSFECFRLEQVSDEKFVPSKGLLINIRGTVAVQVRLETHQTNNFGWEVRNFMPGADVELGAPISKNEQWQVLVRPCEATAHKPSSSEKAQTNGAPILLKRSLVTMYIERELLFLWCGIAFWMVAIILINRTRRPSRKVRRLSLKATRTGGGND